MEGETVTLQDLFRPALRTRARWHEGMPMQLLESLVTTGLRPQFLPKMAANGADVPTHVFAGEGA